MIPLAVKCDVSDRSAPPFVARVDLGLLGAPSGPHDARLIAEDGNRLVLQTNDNVLGLPKVAGGISDGDVLYVEPLSNLAQRWIRANSPHNTLLVTEQCDQLCLMCSQPPKKTHRDQFESFAAACSIAPQGMTIGLSGGEPTLYKQALFDLLERMATERRDLKFHVLTNGQHFEERDIRTLRKLQNAFWGVPLYAAEPELHDEIVGKANAFKRLENGLSILGLSGSAIELRTVVTKRNVKALPRLSDFIVSRLSFIDVWALMQLEHIGFAKNRWADLFFDHSADFGAIHKACLHARLHSIELALYNFPLCTVPREWRAFAPKSISDWKNKYLSECADCDLKSQCAGFFEWHPEKHGYTKMEPL